MTTAKQGEGVSMGNGVAGDKTKNEQWFLYPENVPIFYDEINISRPLLFATETDEGTHIRLGAFHDQAGGFVESGDPQRTVYTAHSVRSFYEFPFPPAGLTKPFPPSEAL